MEKELDTQLTLEFNNNSNSDHQKYSAEVEQADPRRLIPELCRHFYNLGWASGKRICNANFLTTLIIVQFIITFSSFIYLSI